jgi:hypothetical protein
LCAIIATMGEPVGYMARTRAYYEAQGFETPYAWAHHESVPFCRPEKPLAQSTLTVITTAALHDRAPTEPRAVASFASAQPPSRLYANDLSWDRGATHMDDINSYLPVAALDAAVAAGRIGGLANRFHCAPTEFSTRRTIATDAPELLARASKDRADIALLVPL